MRAAKVQASLRIRAVSPEPPLLAHTSSESRGTFRQKTRSLAPLNGWACAVKICHDGMLEDTNSLDGAHLFTYLSNYLFCSGIMKFIALSVLSLFAVLGLIECMGYGYQQSYYPVPAPFLVPPPRGGGGGGGGGFCEYM